MDSTRGDQEQQRRAQGVALVGKANHLAAVVAVGDVSGHQKQDDAGKKLREADEAEVQRTLGDFVDLPSDGHGLHLRGEDDAESRYLEEDEAGISEGNTPASD